MVCITPPWLVNVYSACVQVGWGSLLGDLQLKLRSVWQIANCMSNLFCMYCSAPYIMCIVFAVTIITLWLFSDVD